LSLRLRLRLRMRLRLLCCHLGFQIGHLLCHLL
jgi:hypothetical protein